jgi:hypothetical protein
MNLRNVNQLTKWIIAMLEFLNSSSFEFYITTIFSLLILIGANHTVNHYEPDNTDTNNYFGIIASFIVPFLFCFLIASGISGISDDSKRWIVTIFVVYFAYQVGRLSVAIKWTERSVKKD